MSFIISLVEYFNVQENFVWKVIDMLYLVCNMPQVYAKSISIKLASYLDGILNLFLKSLRRNICDIEGVGKVNRAQTPRPLALVHRQY